ncbi:MAG: peptidoglycan bridge formation glycyltransferase FemA/FemB family protein [Peptococcaceae bacterium]|nr:peptidoglycan bridge formation glycyltransferase FemA/FemB family protein [Peptococcaceae bacterium]
MGFTAKWIDSSEKKAFNDFIAGQAKGHVLQTWEWGEIKSRTGWRPWRLLVEEDGQICACVSILERKLPLFKAVIFYAPRGPILDWRREDLYTFVLQEIRKLAKKRQAVFFKIDPDIPSAEIRLANWLRGQGFHSLEPGKGFEGVQPKYVFRLDISPEEDELLKNMQQKTRYNIRLAQKKGVQIRKGTREDLPVFYQILKETTERDQFLVRAYAYFEDLYDTLAPASLAELFIGEYEGVAIAGTLAFVIGDKAWYIYGASANAQRNVMPNYLIQWEMIRWAKSLGCTMYDFRGVPGQLTEDNPLYGLYRFKKGFNGAYTEFIGEWDQVYRPVFYRLWHCMEYVYSEWLKGWLGRRRKA